MLFVIFPQKNRILTDPEAYGITPGSAGEEAALKEIKHEAVVLSKLHHDRILSFRGVVASPDGRAAIYILFELANCSLKGYLKSLGRPLSLLECKHMGMLMWIVCCGV